MHAWARGAFNRRFSIRITEPSWTGVAVAMNKKDFVCFLHCNCGTFGWSGSLFDWCSHCCIIGLEKLLLSIVCVQASNSDRGCASRLTLRDWCVFRGWYIIAGISLQIFFGASLSVSYGIVESCASGPLYEFRCLPEWLTIRLLLLQFYSAQSNVCGLFRHTCSQSSLFRRLSTDWDDPYTVHYEICRLGEIRKVCCASKQA